MKLSYADLAREVTELYHSYLDRQAELAREAPDREYSLSAGTVSDSAHNEAWAEYEAEYEAAEEAETESFYQNLES